MEFVQLRIIYVLVKGDRMKFININEASEILGMHPQTVRKLAKAGEIPCKRPGLGKKQPQYKFIPEKLYEWMDQDLPEICLVSHKVANG